MDRDSGFGANGSPYEYTVSEGKSKNLFFRKLTLIALYCLWVIGFFAAGLMIKLIVPMMALIPVTLWMLVFFTWRFTQVEYEYSYFSGVLTVSRVLGGRSRKVLVKVSLRTLSAVYPCNEVYAARIDAFGEEKVIFAASGEQSPTLYAALWSDEEGGKQVLYFEPTEKALKIIKYYNASAVALGTH